MNKKENLDIELIIHHYGNFTVDKVIDFFIELDIKNFKKFKEKIGADYVRNINKIVEQRNTISHSLLISSDRFTFENIKNEIIIVFENFAKELKSLIVNRVKVLRNQKKA